MYALSSVHFANLIQIRTHVRTSVLRAAHVAEMYVHMHVRTYEVCLSTYLRNTPHGLDTTYVHTLHTIGIVLSLMCTSYTTLYYIFTS